MKTSQWLIVVTLLTAFTGCQSSTLASSNRLDGYRFQNTKPWGYQIVSNPVRAGKEAQRFEVRPGDCGETSGWSDCRVGNERSEIELRRDIPFPGNVWIGWSVYLPSDFSNGRNLYQAKIFQLKFRDGPERDEVNSSNTFTQLLNLQIERDGDALTMCVYRFSKTASGWKDRCDKSRIAGVGQMRGKWTDILLNYDSRGTGALTVYVNGQARSTERDFVAFDSDKVFVAYGIYRPVGAMSGPIPTQVVYVDEMRIGSSRDEVEVQSERPVD